MINQRNFFTSIFMILVFCTHAQTVTQLADMPEPVTNQAIAYADVNGNGYVYSFAGIDETKLFSGIHQKAFKYDVQADSWETIAPLPSGNGRIAASASFVKGKIYIIGGYEVFEDQSEISVDLVHVYDPVTDTYQADATPIPIPIDDHIQAVWRDSLIYVVTGWSNITNVPDVQIYNPSNNEWQVGTPVPNTITYKVFGSSGVIVGDTIYYAGGAKISGSFFSSSNVVRKGVINPDNPAEITWSHDFSASAEGYRMGAAVWKDQRPIWIGGAGDEYNFDGISYNGGVGVEPNERILELRPETGTLEETNLALPIMDIREVAQAGPNTIIICGGMASGQTVSNATFSLDISLVSTSKLNPNANRKIFPVPANNKIYIDAAEDQAYEIYDLLGNILLQGQYRHSAGINISNLKTGAYLLSLYDDGYKKRGTQVIIKK